MRFAHLLSLGACAHHCYTSEGLVVLRDHTNHVYGVAATMYRREQGPRWFGQKLDSEDGGERSGRGFPEGTPKTHLRVGRPGLSKELPDRELGSCEGLLARGSNED